ncbi:MAG TPA: polysaccharide biosynthesis tyrosine autokinase [Baekduia sp.]|nr:polysaccharide biosynthesis tyrosine autokinase [Baekduia sp.]
MARDERAQDLRDHLTTLRRRIWVVVPVVIALPLLVFVLSKSTTKQYEASATLQVESRGVDPTLLQGQPRDPGLDDQELAATARVVQTLSAARSVARRVEPPGDPEQLRDRIAVEADPEANFLTITAKSVDPERAAEVANTYAQVLRLSRTNDAVARIRRATTELEATLAGMPEEDRNGRRQLSQQIQRLRALAATQGGNITVLERALPPDDASSPKPVRDTLVAVPIALLLGLGLVLLLERLNRRLRDVEELRELTPLPLLAVVPPSAFPGRTARGDEDLEAFRMLRTSLMYVNVDDPPQDVVITSAGAGEGKTTVSVGLAHVAALADKRVVLVDADLRRPRVRERFGLDPGPGLEDVLTGDVSLDDALHEIPGTHGMLHVLASSAVGHPSELVASEAMRRLLRELTERFDLVIVDTPPVLAVSDAVPLFEQCSATVLVVRMGATHREAARRALEMVAQARGRVAGIAATDVKITDSYGAYGRYHYAERTAGTRRPVPALQSTRSRRSER